MNTSLTYEETNVAQPALTRKSGFYEGLVLRTLRSFVHGGLRVVLPDGKNQLFGEEGAPITAEIRIRDQAFFKHVALFGNVGFGESYVHGDWDTDDIAAVISWFILNLSKTQGSRTSSSKVAFVNLLNLVNRAHHLLRPNSVTTSRRNIAEIVGQNI